MIGTGFTTQKSLLVRSLIVAAVLAAFYLANYLFDRLERHYAQPVTLHFKLPIPDKIAKTFGVSTRPEIDRVLMSGFFF